MIDFFNPDGEKLTTSIYDKVVTLSASENNFSFKQSKSKLTVNDQLEKGDKISISPSEVTTLSGTGESGYTLSGNLFGFKMNDSTAKKGEAS